MSRLKTKLARRKRSEETRSFDPVSQEQPSTLLIQKLKKRIKKIERSRRPEHSSANPENAPWEPRLNLAGEEIHTEAGAVLVCTKRYPESYHHGLFAAADFLHAGPGLAVLAKEARLSHMDFSRALFLDTETTGLSGGTGTLPFLVGVGWLEPSGVFQVEQYFCREPGEENAQLTLLSERLASALCLVTFNGRGFDLPLLNTRFILHKMKNPAYGRPHLDLLPVARRVFKKRLDSCRLGNLEASVLGFERIGDIPGSEIPAVYAAYLRGGPVEPIEAVLEHNALDLVGLAALGSCLEEMYQNPKRVKHGLDGLGLAKAALLCGEKETADRHLTHAAPSAPREESAQVYLLAAREASRRRDYPAAKGLLFKAMVRDPADPRIRLALAKHFEHREKDFVAALEHARLTAEAEGKAQSQHRIARLERRLKRQSVL